MADDSSTTEHPEPAIPLLDGMTAEWNVTDVLRVAAEGEPAMRCSATAMPLPPSKRGVAPTAFKAGSAAPGGASATSQPLLTVPKPRQKIEVEGQPSVLLAHDPNATLPPRDARATSAPARRRHARPSFIAIGVAIGCTFGYAVWASAQRPTAVDAAPERGLPRFLTEGPPATGAAAAASGADSPIQPALPPAALAASSAPDSAVLGTGDERASADAGVSAALTALEAAVEPAPSAPVTAQAHDSAALQAQLNAPGGEPSARADATRAARESSIAAPSSSARRPAARSSKATRATTADAPNPRPRATVRPLTTYAYADQVLFPVATAPKRVTDLVLERGEMLAAQPTAGDAALWVVNVVQGADRTHVFVTPLRPGLRTNLTLATNRRTYFLELSSRDDGAYMAGVQWTYPRDYAERRREALARAERERQTLTAVSDLQALRFDYAIDATEGARAWKPTMVFHDGKKTFIRFPKPIDPERAPILLIPRTGNARDATYVNYRVKGDVYVVDRLLDAAELRLPGARGQDIVRIKRRQ